jgi:hypothetical protein
MHNEYEEEINNYIATKKKMLYDYEFMYEACLKNPNLINELNEFRKKTLWMDECTMLLVNNKVEHNCEETHCNIVFENKNGAYDHGEHFNFYPFHYTDANYGIFIHTDCYKYIKLKYNIELKYNNLPLIESENKSKTHIILYLIKFIDRGDIKNYQRQNFQFEKVFLDNKQYLCSSPLKNDKNITQIKKNINSMKISNKYLSRPSPPISATFYSDDIIKVGNNGKLWTIRNGKWNEIKKEVCEISITFNYHTKTKKNINKNTKQIHKKQINFLKKLSWIGQYNKYGTFIKNFTVDKNIGYATILTTVDNKDMIEKLFI